MSKKPMPVLIIEDDDAACRKFRECAGNRTDLALVGTTNSSDEGLQIVKNRLPEGVILDLELTRGKGDGMQFLTALRDAKLPLRPVVVVTTNIQTEIMHNSVHGLGVAFVFFKKQPGYSPDMVFNMLLNLRGSLLSAPEDGRRAVESPHDRKERILNMIDNELNEVGISIRLKGRQYLREAIYQMVTKDKSESAAVIYEVAKKRGIGYNSVIRSIQTAINRAWDSTDIETLKERYPAPIDIRTGVPAPMEFVHYFSGKILKAL